jgi:non-ribosomal peptide synthetase component F
MTDLDTRDDRQTDIVPSLSAADEALPACFERVAAAHRLRPALFSDAWSPTYEELNATANRLAHALIARGGAPGNRIAILMQHDTPQIATMLAVLKAGRIVVTLDATHPTARLAQLMQDAEPALVVADAVNRDLAANIANMNCDVISFENGSTTGPTHNPPTVVEPGSVAFLVYTSGSTGRPKGVMQTHRQHLRIAGIHTGWGSPRTTAFPCSDP